MCEFTKEQIMKKNYEEVAVRIQDASNIVAVTNELCEAMKKARYNERNPAKDDAVIGIFFKLYDMMYAPSTKEMYDALTRCEMLVAAKNVKKMDADYHG